MAKLIDSKSQDWQPVRPDLTTGVSGKQLFAGAIKMVLAKVAPGGVFRSHRDRYGHLFHILSGQALAKVEAQEYRLSAGMSLQVDAGEEHGYENCGEEDLLLISINLPQV